MRAYSTDLRERIVRAVGSGRPQREAARLFGVGITTVKRYVVRHQQTGSLERQPIAGGVRRIGQDREAILLARLEDAPDATLAEHCAWWAAHQSQRISVATMCRALHRLGWTHKKSRWQPANATPRRGQPGARTSPSGTPSRSSLSTNPAPTPP
jgi:transposase